MRVSAAAIVAFTCGALAGVGRMRRCPTTRLTPPRRRHDRLTPLPDVTLTPEEEEPCGRCCHPIGRRSRCSSITASARRATSRTPRTPRTGSVRRLREADDDDRARGLPDDRSRHVRPLRAGRVRRPAAAAAPPHLRRRSGGLLDGRRRHPGRARFNAVMFVDVGRVEDGDPEYLTWDELDTVRESGRWELQLHSGEGHQQIQYGPGRRRLRAVLRLQEGRRGLRRVAGAGARRHRMGRADARRPRHGLRAARVRRSPTATTARTGRTTRGSRPTCSAG